MRRCFVFVLLTGLLLGLCMAAYAEGSVCIGTDGTIAFTHGYAQGICRDCGYIYENCIHENMVSAGIQFEKTEKLGAEFHAYTHFYSESCGFCLDCRSTLIDGEAQAVPEEQYGYEYTVQQHTMENSVCVECGYMQVLCFKKY